MDRDGDGDDNGAWVSIKAMYNIGVTVDGFRDNCFYTPLTPTDTLLILTACFGQGAKSLPNSQTPFIQRRDSLNQKPFCRHSNGLNETFMQG